MELISVEQFRKEARSKRKPTAAIFRDVTEEPVPDEASRKIRFCFSDGSVDRMGDTIDPNGWDLQDFKANPVALWAHDSSQPPIGRASNVIVEGARLMGDIEFIPAETYAFSDTIYRLVRGKFLNAVSVGFLPLEYSFVENDPDRGWGIDFKRQQLLEISVCPVPANPNALADARSKGIDTRPLVEWAERVLDLGGADLKRTLISRDELQRLRKAAKEPAMPRARTRSDNDEDDAPKGKCGRAKDAACGMSDAAECSIHAGLKADEPIDPNDEKALRRALRKLLGPRYRADEDDPGSDPNGEEPPLAHEDAIRMAHKCLRTAKAFMTEGMVHHNKAVDLLGDVVDALNDSSGDDDRSDDEKSEEDPEDEKPDTDKAARLARAEQRRRRLAAA